MTAFDPDTAIYLHGLPGSAAELLAALALPSLPAGVHVLDRLGTPGRENDAALLAAFNAVAHEPRALIGFSLGAMSALKLAALRPGRVSSVHLISPAAPLELGDFLPHMAGRAVFEAARMGLWPLAALSMVQSAVASGLPDTLLAGMFQGSAPAEQNLSAQPTFRHALLQSLRMCLRQHRAAYHRELMTYVKPWADTLSQVRCDVAIWHGEQDGWAPIAMAHALKANLPGQVDLAICKDLGHFSTLHRCLPDVLAAAARR